MALRLAGQPYPVIQGADAQGWLREVTANDTTPGLKVNQQGPGRIFDFQDGGASKLYLPDGGNVTLVGSLVFDLANDVTITATNPAAPRTLTIPDPGGNDTFAFLGVAQTFTAAQTFRLAAAAGAAATHANSGVIVENNGSALVERGGLVCLNSAARFDKWNHAAVR